MRYRCMTNWLLLLCLCICLAVNATCASDSVRKEIITTGNESVVIELDNRNWETVHRLKDKDRTLYGWRLRPAPNERWTEQIMVWSFSKRTHPLPPLEDAMKPLRDVMLRRCEDIYWQVLDKTDNSILYEWHSARCPSIDLQYQIIRIVDGQDNRFRIGISQRFSHLPDDKRKKWIAWLAAIKVMSNQ